MNNLKTGIALLATLAVVAMPINAANAQGPKYFPNFKVDKTCAHISVYDFAEIHLNVNRTLNDAVLAVDFEKSSTEYKTSFGEYDRTRHTKVRNRMKLIRDGTYKIQIIVKCETPGQSSVCKQDMTKSGLAWASKTEHVINLCPVYFEASKDLVRKISPWNNKSTMQGDIFLHELTHFSWKNSKISAGRTVDDEYDQEGVEYLAEDDPDLAIDNADSYRIFMMKLAVRNRTIYR